MYDLRFADFNTLHTGSHVVGRYYDEAVEAVATGARRCQALCFRAALWRLWDRLTGGSHRLLDLNEVKASGRLLGSCDDGIRTVPLKQIVGSEGRTTDFDREFRPVSECTRQRWAAIYAARLMGTPMPPVCLVRIGDHYFVRDGHHRISVARQLREEFIEAEVTVWEMAFEGERRLVLEPAA